MNNRMKHVVSVMAATCYWEVRTTITRSLNNISSREELPFCPSKCNIFFVNSLVAIFSKDSHPDKAKTYNGAKKQT